MSPEQYRDLIPFYVARTLTAADHQAFEARLAADPALRDEVDEWRIIADAVWRESDEIARSLPPLSQGVYERLAYRGASPQTAPSGSVSQATLRQPHVRPSPKNSLTLAAGMALILVFGGLLLLMAARMNQQTQPVRIAQDGTPNAISGAFGASSTMTPAPHTPDSGIMQASPGVIVPPTDTPTVPLSTLHAQLQSELTAPPGVLMVITPAPDECLIYNAGKRAVEVYESAVTDAEKIGEMSPGQQYRSRVQSADGWYKITLSDGRNAWVKSGQITAVGNCHVLPVMTATPAPTLTLMPVVLTIPATAEIAVVRDRVTDLRRGPNLAYEIVMSAPKNTQFAVRGYFGSGDDRWIYTVLNNGQQAWLSLNAADILPVGEMTPAAE